jgi:hypothetical protein
LDFDMDDTTDNLPDTIDASALMSVQVLADGLPALAGEAGVTLRGRAAGDVTDALREVAKQSWRLGRRAAEKTYRLVPSEKTAQGLKDGTLSWADASSGDASVLVKNTKTGKIAGRGDLKAVTPSPAKLLGPAAWEAMAMATQQHYLVEINDQLESIASDVKTVLARDDADKSGWLTSTQDAVVRAREALADGKLPSPPALAELRDLVTQSTVVWNQLHGRLVSDLTAYRGSETPKQRAAVEKSWELLVTATRVLGEASAFLTTLPFESAAALESVIAEEQSRVRQMLQRFQAVARDVALAHIDWRRAWMEWEVFGTRNPVSRRVRRARGLPSPSSAPAQDMLHAQVARQAAQLARPFAPPAALLVTVRRDGSVVVAPEGSAPLV